MRYHQIVSERNLPLRKGGLAPMRGSYAAFVITLHPEDFLRLTADTFDRARIEADKYPADRERYIEIMGRDTDHNRFEMPFLTIEYPSGKIVGHEGRHRALMVLRGGGTSFPVAIMMRHATTYSVTYESGDEDHVEEFAKYDDARERVDWLKAEAKRALHDLDYDGPFYHRIKLNTHSGGTIKGSPGLADPNDPYNRKAYQIEDMPKQLIAQHTNDLVVTDFKVGLMKGYRHFR